MKLEQMQFHALNKFYIAIARSEIFTTHSLQFHLLKHMYAPGKWPTVHCHCTGWKLLYCTGNTGFARGRKEHVLRGP